MLVSMKDESESRTSIRSTSAQLVVQRAAESCLGGELVLSY